MANRWYGAPDRSGVGLLGLGSGPGACAWYVAREGFHVWAIEVSRTAVSLLEKRFAEERLSVDARVGDIVALPWLDRSFHGVVENAVLYANPLASCRGIVDEVCRVLKPGGWYMSANFSDRCWGTVWGVEPGGFTDITQGPFRGKGFALFTSRAQVDELYRGFSAVKVDRISWTLDGSTHVMELWVVTGRKPEVL